jgi:glycosyltransferase involved in cell wall biosynthesis
MFVTTNLTIAILIPCFNEETTIRQVISDFKKNLPNARIYVYDNNSNDNTVQVALDAGATVKHEKRQGKGNVVARMFADIEADVYVLVDGDATYDSSSIQKMIQTLINGPYDMVNAARISQSSEAYRPGHTLGNRLFSYIVRKIFGKSLSDLFSGYRIFSRRFVKSFPCFSKGFEIETDLTIHALSLHIPIIEIQTPYYARPPGSFSKLSTFRDGWRILGVIFNLVRTEKPLLFFFSFSILFLAASFLLGLPIISEFLKIGSVPRLPSAILAASFGIMSFLSLISGFILDGVTISRKETKRLRYLSFTASQIHTLMEEPSLI